MFSCFYGSKQEKIPLICPVVKSQPIKNDQIILEDISYKLDKIFEFVKRESTDRLKSNIIIDQDIETKFMGTTQEKMKYCEFMDMIQEKMKYCEFMDINQEQKSLEELKSKINLEIDKLKIKQYYYTIQSEKTHYDSREWVKKQNENYKNGIIPLWVKKQSEKFIKKDKKEQRNYNGATTRQKNESK